MKKGKDMDKHIHTSKQEAKLSLG